MPTWTNLSLSQPWSLVCYALLVFTAAWMTTAGVLRHGRILDHPNERSSHNRPTPRGGGLAIVVGLMLGLALIHLTGQDALHQELHTLRLGGLVTALILIAGISYCDDLRGQGVASKLLVHLLAALLALWAGLLPDRDLLPAIPSWLGATLAMIWLLGLTNAYNFMDGLDAMAAATAVVVASLFALLCGLQGLELPMLLSLALAAGSGGFLCFNWPPARIFMGDIGSTFLGFALAALGLWHAQSSALEPLAALLIMPILLLHYLFDTLFTFCRRLLRGERVTQAHRSHLYQLLNRSGYTHRHVSLLYAAMALLQGLTLMIWQQAHGSLTDLLVLLGLLLLVQVWHACWVMRRARRNGLL